ncbi:unnamed protein product [Parnassius apollo]|uniref:(apollo) hypothetical protein n=1 Tax=Parnassius apollo TaxID=110799 RepID=A0A8S3Y007_PARAO|nr:unnamed protein product [Parnassius apollo]
MADGKKQRSARLVNLALNQIETDNSSLNTSNRAKLFTGQNWTRRRAKVLSKHFECETHTESCNALDHAESIIHNIQHSKRDVTSPHLKKLELSIPIFHESTVREFAQSAMQFTSTSGPSRSWISQNKIMNPKLMVMDIVEKDNPISDNSQGTIFNLLLPIERQLTELELTDIIGTTSEHENISNRSENENLPISDEQLLQILEDPDENYDDDIFDADFNENMNHSDNDSDTSIVSEDELVLLEILRKIKNGQITIDRLEELILKEIL